MKRDDRGQLRFVNNHCTPARVCRGNVEKRERERKRRRVYERERETQQGREGEREKRERQLGYIFTGISRTKKCSFFLTLLASFPPSSPLPSSSLLSPPPHLFTFFITFTFSIKTPVRDRKGEKGTSLPTVPDYDLSRYDKRRTTRDGGRLRARDGREKGARGNGRGERRIRYTIR